MNDIEWLELREDAATHFKRIHENALKHYLDEIGFADTFAYEYSYSENRFIIYTQRPGIWIGRHGSGVDRLKEILSEEVKADCHVSFREINGHFVSSHVQSPSYEKLNKVIDDMISAVRDWSHSTDVISCETIIDMLEARKLGD